MLQSFDVGQNVVELPSEQVDLGLHQLERAVLCIESVTFDEPPGLVDTIEIHENIGCLRDNLVLRRASRAFSAPKYAEGAIVLAAKPQQTSREQASVT